MIRLVTASERQQCGGQSAQARQIKTAASLVDAKLVGRLEGNPFAKVLHQRPVPTRQP